MRQIPGRLASGLAAILLIVSAAPGALAQDGGDEACPAIVAAAYESAQTVCVELGRDQACYGNAEVLATPDTLAFSQPGDMADLSAVESLRLGALDVDAGTWGLSLLRVQAGLPDETPENVEIVLFGDVEIIPAAGQGEPVTVQVTPGGEQILNVRGGPSTNAALVGTLAPGTTVSADGRSAAGDWLRITLPEGVRGWVYAPLVEVEGEAGALVIVSSLDAAPVYGPMQAFTFRSGVDDSPCAAAPSSGLLIQTPQGVGEITLLINEVVIQLGSTAYLQAAPGEQMAVRVVEGEAQVTAQDATVSVPAGAETLIPLDETGIAAAPPQPPAPYDPAPLEVLPLDLLPRAVTVAPPLAEEEPAEESGTGESTAAPSSGPSNTPAAPTGQMRHYLINFCTGITDGGGPILAGQTVRFAVGCCGSPTIEEQQAREAQAGPPWITLDGAMLPIYITGIFWAPVGWYTNDGRYEWVATPGTHTVAGAWGSNPADTCTFTVQ